MKKAAALALGAVAVAGLARAFRGKSPRALFDGPAEGYAPLEPPSICDPNEKPGVAAFREWVLRRFGGGDLGIVRDCEVGNPSHHHEGRAWDWAVNAKNPADVERVAELLNFLSRSSASGEPDDVWRRAGLRYVIWDGLITTPGELPRTRAYQGPNAHRDHVHFSFSRAGAAGDTSFYRWLGAGEPMGG